MKFSGVYISKKFAINAFYIYKKNLAESLFRIQLKVIVIIFIIYTNPNLAVN